MIHIFFFFIMSTSVAMERMVAPAHEEILNQFMGQMTDAYSHEGMDLTKGGEWLNQTAFLDFLEFKEGLRGYKVLLIRGTEVKKNIEAYLSFYDGKVIIVTGGTASGATKVALDVYEKRRYNEEFGRSGCSDFVPNVKFVVFAPEFSVMTGILSGTKDEKVDLRIALNADEVFTTNRDGGMYMCQMHMMATCAAAGADCFL